VPDPGLRRVKNRSDARGSKILLHGGDASRSGMRNPSGEALVAVRKVSGNGASGGRGTSGRLSNARVTAMQTA
jgi:hypothetical protein